MSCFNIKCHAAGAKTAAPSFYIQSKGANAGRPSKHPTPNCFRVTPNNPEKLNRYYWVAYSLAKTGGFKPFHYGSVIPFIRIGDCKNLLNQVILNVERNPATLSKSIALLQDIEQKKSHFQAVVNHIDILHQALLQRLLAK